MLSVGSILKSGRGKKKGKENWNEKKEKELKKKEGGKGRRKKERNKEEAVIRVIVAFEYAGFCWIVFA